MVVYHGGEDLSPCVAALGFFDGVHLGHRALLAEAKAEANRLALPLAVLTFPSDSPIKQGAPRIYGDGEKLLLLSSCGADEVYFCDFNAVRDMEPEEFVRKILVGKLHAKAAVCGFNFRFGKAAGGDAALLARLAGAQGCRAIVLPPYRAEGGILSATKIRSALAAGEIGRANSLLGAPYFLLGSVRHGRGFGHTIGLPTANFDLPGDLILRRGVYRTAVVIGEEKLPALTNIGVCPTFGVRALHAETFIPGFSGDLYGRDFRLDFLGFLRDERVFPSAEELKKQINVDILTANEQNEADLYYKKEEVKWQEAGQNLPR